MFCRILCCFIAKFLFYAIYAVLLRNLFCRDLRALAWRKIGPTILSVEKKGQISGMPLPPQNREKTMERYFVASAQRNVPTALKTSISENPLGPILTV